MGSSIPGSSFDVLASTATCDGHEQLWYQKAYYPSAENAVFQSARSFLMYVNVEVALPQEDNVDSHEWAKRDSP